MLVTYNFKGVTVGTSGDVILGWVKAPAGVDLTVVSIGGTIVGAVTATDPPTTWEVHRYTTDGTSAAGTPTGAKTDGTASAAVGSSAQAGPFSAAPTDGGVVDGLPLPTGQPFFQVYGDDAKIKAGERWGVLVNRNSATGSATGTLAIKVREGS